jgi:hypothetical protein
MQKDGDRKAKPENALQVVKARIILQQTNVSSVSYRTHAVWTPHTQFRYTRHLQVRHARHQPNPTTEWVNEQVMACVCMRLQELLLAGRTG